MAQDRLPIWPTLSPEELSSTYARHATLGRSIAEHAPPDVTDELAAAFDRQQDDRASAQAGQWGTSDPSVLAEAQRRRNQWAARHRDEITTWSQLDGTVRRYEYRLAQAASYSRPEYLTRFLAPLPESITATERWQAAAGAIEGYRTRFDVTSPQALGPEPGDPEQRAHWQNTIATVGSAGFLNPDGSECAGPLAELTAEVSSRRPRRRGRGRTERRLRVLIRPDYRRHNGAGCKAARIPGTPVSSVVQ